MDREESRSDPKLRDMATMMARPSPASQAPKLRKKKRKNGLFWFPRAWVSSVRAVKVSRILSVARRIIRRRERCERNRRRENIKGRKIMMSRGECGIACGLRTFFRLTRPALELY